MPPKNTRSCELCGTPFIPRTGRVAVGLGRFCSRRCAAKSVRRDSVALFWAKVDRSGGSDACWLFTGCITKAGYGQLTIKRKRIYAHRMAYELLIGPIPEGWHLHHQKELGCIGRQCCNPAHLKPMPQPEHASTDSWQRRKTHCPQGHPYDVANTGHHIRGGRYCKQCNRERSLRNYYIKRR